MVGMGLSALSTSNLLHARAGAPAAGCALVTRITAPRFPSPCTLPAKQPKSDVTLGCSQVSPVSGNNLTVGCLAPSRTKRYWVALYDSISNHVGGCPTTFACGAPSPYKEPQFQFTFPVGSY